jgi:hypothetical protein
MMEIFVSNKYTVRRKSKLKLDNEYSGKFTLYLYKFR